MADDPEFEDVEAEDQDSEARDIESDDLKAQVAEHAAAIKALHRNTTRGVLETGWHLIQVKDLLGHGSFLPWIDREFHFSAKTAERWMNAAEAFDGKFDTVSNFFDLTAVYVLSAKGGSQRSRDEALQIAETGTRITKKLAKDIVWGRTPPRFNTLGFFEEDDWHRNTDEADPLDGSTDSSICSSRGEGSLDVFDIPHAPPEVIPPDDTVPWLKSFVGKINRLRRDEIRRTGGTSFFPELDRQYTRGIWRQLAKLVVEVFSDNNERFALLLEEVAKVSESQQQVKG